MPKTRPDQSTLKEYPQGSIVTKLNDQFIDEQVALYMKRKEEAAKKAIEEKDKDTSKYSSSEPGPVVPVLKNEEMLAVSES